MTGSVQKWGNSLALRIPSSAAKELGLRQGSAVEVVVREGALVVKPTGRRKLSFDKMINGITEENIHRESDWGSASGREAW